MGKIDLTLESQYKSLDANTTYELVGDLIVLSGVNGSGKSHFADVLRGVNRRDNNQRINRSLKIDGITCSPGQVILRTFSDAANLGDINQTGTQLTTSHKEQVWSSYSNTRLNASDSRNENYVLSVQKAKDTLVSKYGQQRFDGGLTQSEINRAIPTSFAWLPDDIFQNSVLQIFFSHARKEERAAVHRDRGRTPEAIGEKPWILLNHLFQRLGFDYRFREDYELEDSGELNYPVVLHPINQNGDVNYDQIRSLSELSDGEKTIISLAYSSIGDINPAETKLLVLDEFDAPLNPSLTKILFEVLNIYFLEKGVVVVLITHSPSSIAMAPEPTSFYEMFKPVSISNSQSRIQKVGREEYDDMQVALDRYFDQITDNKQRLESLSAENEYLKSLVTEADSAKKIQLITEGKNVAHIRHALIILKPELLQNSVHIVTQAEHVTGSQQLKNAFEIGSVANTTDHFLFVWDVDASQMVGRLNSTANFTAFCFAENEANTISRYEDGKACGIENLYSDDLFTADVYGVTTKLGPQGKETKIKELDKRKFLEKVEGVSDIAMFANFQPLVDYIDELLEGMGQNSTERRPTVLANA